MNKTIIICVAAAVSVLALGAAVWRMLLKKRKYERSSLSASDLSSPMIDDCIRNYAMEPAFKAHSKNEAIEKLVEIVAARFPQQVKNVAEVKRSVFAREKSMPTGLDNGIAVPHGRTDSVKSIVGAIALVDNSENENGIIPDYEMIDHSKLQIIILTLVPESVQEPYAQVMAFINRTLRNNESREQLLECKTQEEMRKFFNSAN
ncbi:MAG: PTS sugar transporter subunit IIA [Kiritimatiellae bacterium]|nr:PTS sugar transporter subunit IIA [Kiritimatiellia bacterium]